MSFNEFYLKTIHFSSHLFPELQKKKKNAADKKDLVIACKKLGDYFTQEGHYSEALKEYQQEASLHEQLNNKLKCAIANRWIGESYMSLEDFDSALKHVEMYLSEYKMRSSP